MALPLLLASASYVLPAPSPHMWGWRACVQQLHAALLRGRTTREECRRQLLRAAKAATVGPSRPPSWLRVAIEAVWQTRSPLSRVNSTRFASAIGIDLFGSLEPTAALLPLHAFGMSPSNLGTAATTAAATTTWQHPRLPPAGAATPASGSQL